MTRFWGKLLLINFALGVATGIVQEFQFGMAWSEYSRFVGDVFGAPLAIEGLAAFFLESTFLGLWIFGWDRLPQRIHLATIWAVFIGTNLSRVLHPRRQRVDAAARSAPRSTPTPGRAELTSIWRGPDQQDRAVRVRAHRDRGGDDRRDAARRDQRLAPLAQPRHASPRSSPPRCAGACAARSSPALATIVIGHFFGQWMTEVQPMKMAAAEALYETKTSAGLSLFALGGLEKSPDKLAVNIEIPGLLSFMATDSFNGRVEGINDLQRRVPSSATAPATTCPVLGLTYWSFRIMIGLGFFMVVPRRGGPVADAQGARPRQVVHAARDRSACSRRCSRTAPAGSFTEAGRQPWVVQGLLKTADGVSPIASSTVLFSLIVLTLLYAALAVVEVWLFAARGARRPRPGAASPSSGPGGDPYLPSLAY